MVNRLSTTLPLPPFCTLLVRLCQGCPGLQSPTTNPAHNIPCFRFTDHSLQISFRFVQLVHKHYSYSLLHLVPQSAYDEDLERYPCVVINSFMWVSSGACLLSSITFFLFRNFLSPSSGSPLSCNCFNSALCSILWVGFSAIFYSFLIASGAVQTWTLLVIITVFSISLGYESTAAGCWSWSGSWRCFWCCFKYRWRCLASAHDSWTPSCVHQTNIGSVWAGFSDASSYSTVHLAVDALLDRVFIEILIVWRVSDTERNMGFGVGVWFFECMGNVLGVNATYCFPLRLLVWAKNAITSVVSECQSQCTHTRRCGWLMFDIISSDCPFSLSPLQGGRGWIDGVKGC